MGKYVLGEAEWYPVLTVAELGDGEPDRWAHDVPDHLIRAYRAAESVFEEASEAIYRVVLCSREHCRYWRQRGSDVCVQHDASKPHGDPDFKDCACRQCREAQRTGRRVEDHDGKLVVMPE